MSLRPGPPSAQGPLLLELQPLLLQRRLGGEQGLPGLQGRVPGGITAPDFPTQPVPESIDDWGVQRTAARGI